MTVFERAVAVVLRHEGVFSDDPDDPGGPTKYGISLRFLRGMTADLDGDGWMDGDLDHDGDIDIDDIRAMDKERAIDIYHDQFWQRYGYHRLGDFMVATKIFDLSVNMGPRQAHRILQRAIRAGGFHRVTVDGILGPLTFAAANSTWTGLVQASRSEAAGVYRMIVARKPSSAKYISGWLARAYS